MKKRWNRQWRWCQLCKCYYIKCPICGNNCCNGMAGAKGCPNCNCDEAYEYQKNNKPSFGIKVICRIYYVIRLIYTIVFHFKEWWTFRRIFRWERMDKKKFWIRYATLTTAIIVGSARGEFTWLLNMGINLLYTVSLIIFLLTFEGKWKWIKNRANLF